MPHPARLRLVVDTNIWISYLLTNSFAALIQGWNSGSIVLLYSEEMLTEMRDVLARPKVLKRVPASLSNAFLTEFKRNATLVEVTSTVDRCRDKKDNYLLALSKDGAADLLITGDEDLRVLGSFGKTVILSPTEYIAAFK